MNLESVELIDVSSAIVNYRFNEAHTNVSRYLANVNLDKGPDHWSYKAWEPAVGDIDRYTLKNWIGNGRYSDVFAGLQDGERLVAIKVLKPIEALRVRRETKILSILSAHPGITKMIDLVVDRKYHIPSIVMEYADGRPWKKLFWEMRMDDMRWYLYRLLQALDFTHKNGIMHRDVKPLNIMCRDPKISLVLGDWGLAEFYHPTRRYTTHIGTPYYKSPEVVMGYEFYDYSIDIWCVGVILMEMLSLRIHFFDSDSNLKLIKQIARVVGGQKFVDYAAKYEIPAPPSLIEKLRQYQGVDFAELIPPARAEFREPDALDLVSKLMVVDHKERLSAEEALKHPFFDPIRSKC